MQSLHTCRKAILTYPDAVAGWIAVQCSPCQVSKFNHLRTAADYPAFVLDHFLDRVNKMFYFTSASQLDIILRDKELPDNVNPAGNATMALNLIRLGWLLDKPGWVEITPHTISQFIKAITEYPVIFARWEQTYQKLVGSGYVPVVVRWDLPIAVVSGAGPEYSFLVNRPGIEAKLFIYTCYNYSCKLLVSSIQVITNHIIPVKASSNQ